MKNMGKNFKLQSAMEYLMTYGWAILIIAVVLGALFSLGIFNPAFLAPKVQPGSCQVERPEGPGTSAYVSIQGNCNNELPEFVSDFNSYNSYITMPESPSFNPPDLSVSFWIYPKAEGGNDGSSSTFIISNANPNFAGGIWNWAFEFWPNGLDFHSCYNGCNGASNMYLPVNQWSFVTGTYNGIWNLYLNGQYFDSGSGSIEGTPPANITFGTSHCTPGNGCYQGYFDGFLANVQVYNTTLSPAAIQYLYREGIGGDPTSLNNLVGWWPLNGNTKDYSGNDNSGVNSNIIYTNGWTSGYTAT